jgi:hypothetical protein
VERKKEEQQQQQQRVPRAPSEVVEEAQEKILLGANLRSVKPGTMVSLEETSSKDQGEKSSVYRDFDW